jgi:hypothetical protein
MLDKMVQKIEEDLKLKIEKHRKINTVMTHRDIG